MKGNDSDNGCDNDKGDHLVVSEEPCRSTTQEDTCDDSSVSSTLSESFSISSCDESQNSFDYGMSLNKMNAS